MRPALVLFAYAAALMLGAPCLPEHDGQSGHHG